MRDAPKIGAPMNAIASSAWVYPVLESVHVMGIALLVGSLVVFELRVWGFARALDKAVLARLALPVTVIGFAVAATSGALMFASAPGDMLANRAFLAKMGLIVVAGLNAAWFHLRGGVGAGDSLGRWQTASSLLIWLAVIACGRFIAYK